MGPLVWLLIVTFTRVYEKIFSDQPRIGFLAQADQLQDALDAGKVAAAQIAATQTQIFNAQTRCGRLRDFHRACGADIVDSIRVWAGVLRGTRTATVTETPFIPTQLRPEEI